MKNDEVSDDGYFWASKGEKARFQLEDSQILEVTTNEDGYSLGDNYVTITKKLYRLLKSEHPIAIVHYVGVDTNNIRIPVKPCIPFPKAATLANNPLMTPRQSSSFRPPFAGSPAASPALRYASPMNIQKSQIQSLYAPKRPGPTTPQFNMPRQPVLNSQLSIQAAKKKKKGGPDFDDGEDLSGDDFDNFAVYEVSQARFIRNHDFMSEIFSDNQQYFKEETVRDMEKVNEMRRILERQI
ncbi:hypothetical protein ROZALSC1DRAFT_27744, partial [Rozella allomycis CSF55]